MLKPYDPKKSMWVPDGQGGFKEALLENDDGTKATCMVGHEVRITTSTNTKKSNGRVQK